MIRGLLKFFFSITSQTFKNNWWPLYEEMTSLYINIDNMMIIRSLKAWRFHFQHMIACVVAMLKGMPSSNKIIKKRDS